MTRLSVAMTDLPTIEGARFGPSEWRPVTQEEVTAFARLSGDMNPIHIDEAAAAKTPYGRTIAHGLFTLSLVVPLMSDIFEVTGVGMGINYGLNRLRFPAPVPVGESIRVSGEVTSVTEIPGGYQVETSVTFEVSGSDKPAAVAELVLRYYA